MATRYTPGDFFGIGAAIQAMITVYTTAARQTGRTARLIESLHPGDRIVCLNSDHANAMIRKYRDVHNVDPKERDITFVVCPVDYPRDVFNKGTSQGRTILDHGWLEKRYAYVLEHEAEFLDGIERESSGYGETHRQTKEKAAAQSRWLILRR